MAAMTYRVKITHEGREFEAEGDKTFVLEMLKRFSLQANADLFSPLQSKLDSPQRGKKVSRGITTTTSKTLSIREFTQKFSFTKHTDIVLAFGYYLEKYSGVSNFTPADINNCYYDAKLERSNTSQMIVQNIKRGYMMPSRKKGEGKSVYTLTSTGEDFIVSKMSRAS